MVMAVNEGVLKQGVDDTLSKLQILRQRRELLEEKLIQKNNELKNLCIAEAELTGVLPVEIPLEPGESPPIFCHRVAPSFGSSTNVAVKIKNSEADKLEIEKQVQIDMAEAALRVINDVTENRANKRKQRSIYQQCQRKLQELDARLNFIRQSTGSKLQTGIGGTQTYMHNSTKHRMKKPRPPLTGSLRESYAKPAHDTGSVSLSLQEPELNYNREYYGVNCQLPSPGINNHAYVSYSVSNPGERISNTKYSEHEQNVNNNVYILPDQFRTRTLSQGAQRNPSPRGIPSPRYHEAERIHRPITNYSYPEDNRQMAFRPHQDEADSVQKHYRVSQRSPSNEFYPPQPQPRYVQSFDYPSHSKNSPQLPILRPRRDQDTMSVFDGKTQPVPKYHMVDNSLGYWVRQNGDIVCYPEDTYIEKFGSLDRRKHNEVQNIAHSEGQSRYNMVISNPKISPVHRQNQMPNPGNFEPPVPSNRILRTQSLGSVESRQQNRESPLDKDTVDMSRRGKEKGWHETSLDTNYSPPMIPNLPPTNSNHKDRHFEYLPPPVPIPRKDLEPHYRKPVDPHPEFVETQWEEPPPRIINNVNRYYESPKVLEIPAESKPSSHQDTNGVTIPLNSPTNHTIVQPGKYQPYREVTKPFEMSDFYKYSTKFRKRNEANQMAAALTSLGNEVSSIEHKSNPPPVQSKPAQQLTQQPGQFYEPR